MTSEPDFFGYLPAVSKAPKRGAVAIQTFLHYLAAGIAVVGGVAFMSLTAWSFVHALTPIDTQTAHLLTEENQARYDQLLLSDAEQTDDDRAFMSIYEFAVESTGPDEEAFNTAKADLFTGISLGLAIIALGVSVLLAEPSNRTKQRQFDASESGYYLHAKLNYMKDELLYEGPGS